MQNTKLRMKNMADGPDNIISFIFIDTNIYEINIYRAR